ncbi:AMP-dependent synthetase/ligase [Nocardia aurantia]|uniref:Long-chain-fatty-acid--CoA ligase FadD15 n=1 Tax=Nocardia aurantia TaxID=2585199 RepID=A0A7K0DP13_9NOCA|nr:AMP-dependent synthetase/ligase [Nocardia aurantia]MQY27427.1 Long-chain-fatty-acid--CoA ligase FadD15 [Nocardia aurantia]
MTRQEYHVAPLVTMADADGLANVVYESAETRSGAAVFSRRTAEGWQDVGFGEFAALVLGLARGLAAEGIGAGDRVLILGATSYEWSAADFAVLSLGAVTVPVYPTSSAEQVRHIVADSRPRACFTESAEQRDLIEEVAGPAVRGRSWLLGESFDELAATGRAVGADEITRRRLAVRADDLATIVYTSGTTGMPKGCMLTHRNIFAAAANVVELLHTVFRRSPDDPASTLMFLPLAHVYGRVALFGCVWAGVRTGLVAAPAELPAQLPAFRPTFLIGVPYVLEKIRKAARQVIGGADYDVAEAAVIAAGRADRHGAASTAGGAVEENFLRRLRGMLGGRLEYVIAGGASLEPSTADFFAGLGVEIIGAYGLTEASSTVSMSAPKANRPDSVGRPVPGTTIAIADDGEILVRGAQVFPGYWPDGGHADIDWLATGDLGRLDEDGFLFITGRRKEIIVTNSGKNVAPAPLEDRVRLHPLVSNCMVVGEGRSYITALITVDPMILSRWAADNDVDLTGGVPAEDPRLIAEIATAVDAANLLVSRAESIRRFAILPADFSVARGHMTASLRLRRKAIEEDFDAVVEALYRS